MTADFLFQPKNSQQKFFLDVQYWKHDENYLEKQNSEGIFTSWSMFEFQCLLALPDHGRRSRGTSYDDKISVYL